MNKTDRLVYVGGATTREVTRGDWMSAGVNGQDSVSWNALNNYQVPVSDLSEEAAAILLEAHGGEFRILTRTEARSEQAADTKKENAR